MNDGIVFKAVLFTAILDSVGNYEMWHFGTDVSPQVRHMASSLTFFCWAIFGAGMAFLDYCPETGAGALGDGSCHALHGVVRMLVRAALNDEVILD